MSGTTAAARIVIVGAGAAGLIAALRAAALDRPVLLLERDRALPSNTALSGGLFPAAGTRFQAAAGITDSPSRMAADITAKTGPAVDRAVLDMVCGRSAEVAHFIADTAGIALHLRRGGRYPGLGVDRLHGTPDESGADLERLLRAAVGRASGITLRDHAVVTGLVAPDGRVTGVTLEGGETVPADVVLLACGGYGAAPELLGRWCPDIAEAGHIGAASSRGDAVRWGEAVGADLAFMAAYQGHRAHPETGLRLGAELPALGGIFLNRHGRRFVREDMGPSELAAVILAQPDGIAWEVFDAFALEAVQSLGPLRRARAAGLVREAADAATLARVTDLPAEAVSAELAALGPDRPPGPDRLGREPARPPWRPPFYAMAVTGVLAHTQGGLRIDEKARVLRRDGSPVPGLCAAGASAAGISGSGPSGYLPGNGLGHALVTGYVAGEAAAAATGSGGW